MSSEIRVRTSGTWDQDPHQVPTDSKCWGGAEKREFSGQLEGGWTKPPLQWCDVQYMYYTYIYIYIYALYHLGYKTKSWNLKMVWCLLLLPCEGWSCFKVWARLVFSAVAWRKNLPTLKARTMNAPAVLKVIHNYKLLLHFMSTSDETSNLFQVTMCCLEECQDSCFIWLQGCIAGDSFFLSDSQHFKSALSQAEASSL